MFRKMRRYKQQMSDEDAANILKNGTSGVLALLGDGDYPYAVPMSYVYSDGRIYFHCARAGHKLDAIKNHDKASFCVIAKDSVIPDEFTTYYKSVIAFGRVHIIEDEDEKEKALRTLALRYRNVDDELLAKEVNSSIEMLHMLCFDIEHMTGKCSRELTKDE